MMDDAKQLLERFEPKELKVLTADPQVLAARFSPDGNWLAAGTYDGQVRWWNVSAEEPQEQPPLTGHSAWVQAIAFSADSRWLYTADSWGQFKAWDLSQQPAQPVWQHASAHDGWIRDVQVGPHGEQVATCGRDQVVRLWSASDGALQTELRGHNQDVYCLRFHPGGQWLISADDRGVVKQWELASGECRQEFDARLFYKLDRLQDVGGVRALAFDREGTLLAAGGATPKNGGTVQGVPTILVFDFASREVRHTLNLGSPNDCFVHDIEIHEDGFVMAVTSGTPGQGQLLFQRPGDSEPFFKLTKIPNCLSLSRHASSRRLAVVATNRGSNGNGRQLSAAGEYIGNNSPIHLFQMPEPATA